MNRKAIPTSLILVVSMIVFIIYILKLSSNGDAFWSAVSANINNKEEASTALTELAAGFITLVGSVAVLHSIVFVTFSILAFVSYHYFKNVLFRLVCTSLSFFFFVFSLVILLCALSFAPMLNEAQSVGLFFEVLKINISNILVGLVSGGLFLEMLKGLLPKEELLLTRQV